MIAQLSPSVPCGSPSSSSVGVRCTGYLARYSGPVVWPQTFSSSKSRPAAQRWERRIKLMSHAGRGTGRAECCPARRRVGATAAASASRATTAGTSNSIGRDARARPLSSSPKSAAGSPKSGSPKRSSGSVSSPSPYRVNVAAAAHGPGAQHAGCATNNQVTSSPQLVAFAATRCACNHWLSRFVGNATATSAGVSFGGSPRQAARSRRRTSRGRLLGR